MRNHIPLPACPDPVRKTGDQTVRSCRPALGSTYFFTSADPNILTVHTHSRKLSRHVLLILQCPLPSTQFYLCLSLGQFNFCLTFLFYSSIIWYSPSKTVVLVAVSKVDISVRYIQFKDIYELMLISCSRQCEVYNMNSMLTRYGQWPCAAISCNVRAWQGGRNAEVTTGWWQIWTKFDPRQILGGNASPRDRRPWHMASHIWCNMWHSSSFIDKICTCCHLTDWSNLT